MAEQIVDGGFTFTQAELNNKELFRAKVDASRKVLIKALAAMSQPITVWTSGECVLRVRAETSTDTVAVDA